MSESPKVSVIMTSYNHVKYLREAIDSILAQTFSDYELIIWDDASTDSSWEIINSYSDSRIRAFRNEKNQRGGNVRRAIEQAVRGEYIAIHHSDDIWEPQKLEKQVAFLDSHPEIGAVFSWAQIIDEDGRPFTDESHFYYKIFEQPNRTRFEWLNYFFYRGNALCHPSVLIRKQCYIDVGFYRYGLAQLTDFDMWVRLCLKYEIYILPEKLVRFRVRNDEANTSGHRPEVIIRDSFEFLQILKHYMKINNREEFTKIFPSSLAYFESGEHDIHYALVQMALLSKYNFAKYFGLQLLFDLLQDVSRVQKIRQIYGFGPDDFFKLAGQHDVFSAVTIPNLIQQITERDARLAERDARLAERDARLIEIQSSKSWRLAMFFRQVRIWLIPPKSWRARVIKSLFSHTMKKNNT